MKWPKINFNLDLDKFDRGMHQVGVLLTAAGAVDASIGSGGFIAPGGLGLAGFMLIFLASRKR